jgi:nitroreductase
MGGTVKRLVRNVLPNFVYLKIRSFIRYFRTLKCYVYDANIYFSASVNLAESERSKALALIMMKTHVVEKGLTMPEMRFGFGQDRILSLIDVLELFIKDYGCEHERVKYSVGVLAEYLNLHSDKTEILSEILISKIVFLLKTINNEKATTQYNFRKEDYFYEECDFLNFSNSRHSLRNFTGGKVNSEKVINAIKMCRNTPSACNRQSIRVHYYQDYNSIQDILKAQGGNRGFGHLVTSLVVITYDMSVYFEGIERNTGLVDGGLYCMNLLYFLHYQKLGACILNASNDKSKDLLLRKVTNIPDHEAFVAMIGIGAIPNEFSIALSKRDSVSSILKVH